MKTAECKSQNKPFLTKESFTKETIIFSFIQFAFYILHFALLIPPSLRGRRRYIVFEVISEREMNKKALLNEIWDSIYSLYGDAGASESKIRLIGYDKKNDTDRGRGRGILRCAHDKVEEVRAALACIHSVNKAMVGIRVIGISGTIKGSTRLRRQ